MDFRKRLIEIRDFLQPYQNIWQNEIMLKYPDPLNGYPSSWIDELIQFSNKEDIMKIEKKEVFSLLKTPELLAYYRRIEELATLPEAETLPPMPEEHFTWLYVTPKKTHEIRLLSPHVAKLYQEKALKQVVDIGGGIGLLAQTLSNQFQLNVSSVDMDPILQETGKERNRKNAKDPSHLVQYHNLKVEEGGDFEKLLSSESLSLGLHTCGGLALDIIRTSAKRRASGLINFGCCYHKLDNTPGLQNISEFAHQHGRVWLNKFALTLSCRAHKKLSEKDYDLKQKVKFYRYAFHILLHDKYGIQEEIFLGNSHARLYKESFGTYALEQFSRIPVPLKHSKEELEDFFNDPELGLLIKKMIAAGTIRNALGRVLELYLLLDRAIYLEEQGYQVKLQTFFNEELSPRNIGILATL